MHQKHFNRAYWWEEENKQETHNMRSRDLAAQKVSRAKLLPNAGEASERSENHRQN